MGYYFDDNELEHHGIKGQKWGVRRFQNADGSLTEKGQKRYNMKEARAEAVQSRRDRMRANAEYRSAIREPLSRFKKVEDAQLKNLDEKEKAYENAKKTSKEKQQAYKDAKKEYKDSKGLTDEQKAKLKKAAIVGGVAVGTAIAAYGGYKLSQMNKEATKGLSEKYDGLAKRALAESNQWSAKSIYQEMRANTAKSNGNNRAYEIAKDSADFFKESSEGYRVLGESLGNKSKEKKYSLKEKTDYFKEKGSKKSNDDISAELNKYYHQMIKFDPASELKKKSK